MALELGAEVVDDQTLPDEITYAIFAGATREQAESATTVNQFRVATGTTIRIGTVDAATACDRQNQSADQIRVIAAQNYAGGAYRFTAE